MKILENSLKRFIDGYQLLVSPWLGSRCRFVPTCSEYAKQAIDEYGPLRGTGLSIRRVCKCQPWGGSGLDPLPKKHVNVKLNKNNK